MHGPPGSLGEVVRYFFRLGCIAFGGPAAHVGLMRRELVVEKQWLTDQEFVDLLGATNLIPGPNSTEMAMHIGALRAGWRGLWLAGLAFILPAVVIVLALAWAYVEYGDTPAGEGLVFGIQPVVLAIIAQAIWGLRTAALKGPATAVVVAVVVALALAGVSEIALILGSGVALLAWSMLSGGGGRDWPGQVKRAAGTLRRRWSATRIAGGGALLPAGMVFMGDPVRALGAAATAVSTVRTGELFLVFLKIGAVLYGSGYVLISFMQSEFVDSRGWLTQQQLIDAVAVGQFTPGPLFSSATFVGYVADGWAGAAVATLGIFLPSFLFVTLTHPLVPRLRRSPWAAPFLDGVNAAAVALMAVVTVELARDVLDNAWQIALFVAGGAVLLRYRPNSAWLVLAGAAAGLLHEAL